MKSTHKNKWTLWLVFCLNLPILALADNIVLVHGLGAGQVWIEQGIYQTLQTQYKGQHKVYIANLPANAPIQIQAKVLQQQLQQLNHNNPAPIVLVGHSVGGLVSRFLLTKSTHLPIKGLISIATPHLGSNLALMADMAVEVFDDMMPINLNQTLPQQFLLHQIARKSNFLQRLNQQKHPNICYVSIMRKNNITSNFISTQPSQNMNYIAALSGRSYVLLSHNQHALNLWDAQYIKQALKYCHII